MLPELHLVPGLGGRAVEGVTTVGRAREDSGVRKFRDGGGPGGGRITEQVYEQIHSSYHQKWFHT